MLTKSTPAAGLDRPTPRAISERIFKIRATAKASGTSNHFSIPNAKNNPGTPRKSAATGATKKAPAKKINGAKAPGGKRKRGGMLGDAYVYVFLRCPEPKY